MKRLSKTVAACAVVAVMAGFSGHTRAAQLDDATIVAIFDQANMADITTARLGLKKGQSQEVRDLARMVVTDHKAVQRMGRELADELGIIATPPDNDTSLSDQAAAYETLQSMSGEAFDHAYLKHEIAFHASVIEAIETTLLPAIENPKLKALVEKVLPGFKHHLAATKAAAEKLGVK